MGGDAARSSAAEASSTAIAGANPGDRSLRERLAFRPVRLDRCILGLCGGPADAVLPVTVRPGAISGALGGTRPLRASTIPGTDRRAAAARRDLEPLPFAGLVEPRGVEPLTS